MATPSDDLQKAILAALLADPDVAAVAGNRIYDGRPGDSAYPCITFGPSDFAPDDMDGIAGHAEALQLDCWVQDGNRVRLAKSLAHKVSKALHNKALPMETHALASLQVSNVRGFMDKDGLTGHGVVTVEALIEQR